MNFQDQYDAIKSQFPIGKLSKEDVTQAIKNSLQLVEQTSGKPNKVMVSALIYRYLTHNYWYLATHLRFNQSVFNKINESDQKAHLQDNQDFQDLEIVSEFFYQLEKFKPYQLDQSLIDSATEIIFQTDQIADNSALFNLSIKSSYLPIPLQILRQPLQLDLNWIDDQGSTALMHAAQNGINLQFIKRLIENGADPTIRNKKGKTAADLAAYQTVRDYLKNL